MRSISRLMILVTLALPALSETGITPGSLPEVEAQRDGNETLLLRFSQGAFVAGRVADTLSTPWNDTSTGRELNPILRSADGSYGGKGLAIQVGITAGWLIGQELMLKKWGHVGWVHKAITVVNFTGGAVGFGAAIHNGRNR